MSESNKQWAEYKKKGEDVVEPFCGVCLAIPFAFAGVGASAYGANSRGKYKKTRKWALWGGIFTTVISLLIAVYYFFIKKCVDCRYED